MSQPAESKPFPLAAAPSQPKTPPGYTHLESLFLFQSTLTHGVDFARISEVLKGNALIQAGNTYDASRLAPDALQNRFLSLLQEEVKGEGGDGEGAGGGAANNGGSVSPNSKKRKLGSPPLPTLKDAYQHVERIPALVDRLYMRYRDAAVKGIRDEEIKAEKALKVIQLLERNETERLARLAALNGQQAAGSKQPVLPKSATTPSPAQAAAAMRKPASSTTPVIPPKLHIASASPAAAAQGHLPTGPQAARPTPSPKPPAGPSSVLQPPAASPQPPSGVLQAPNQGIRPSISPRPDAANKGKETGPPPLQPAPAAGSLKWEKPYQPLQSAPPAQQAGQQAVPMPPRTQQQWQQQQAQHAAQTQLAAQQAQARGAQKTGVLVPPVASGQAGPAGQPGRQTTTPIMPPIRPASNAPVAPHGTPIQPSQPASVQHPRPLASASPTPPPGQAGTPQRWAQPPLAQGQRPSPSISPAPPSGQKPFPLPAQPARPPIPDHIIRQSVATPGSNRRFTGTIPMPQTPIATSPSSLTRGLGTKWATQSTPSTPNPLNAMNIEPESPAFEPVSPPLRLAALPRASSRVSSGASAVPKAAGKLDAAPRASRIRSSRSAQRDRGASATPSGPETRRSQSVVSHTDQPAEHTTATPRIKDEETPRPHDEAGDSTADESIQGRSNNLTTPGSLRIPKRKRQETPPPVPPVGPPTHVLWTRGFTKVSSSALDQISSHRDANMFATQVRERDAPNYRQIVLQPQDITSIRSAIKSGNKAAVQAAQSLPGGDPGTASLWLPISEDLLPPKGIINSTQLDRELVHMFCNAIMYNPDPDRGPGQTFLKRSAAEEEEIVGYRMDENGIVRNTQNMFVEVEKLLGDLRSAEKERSAPPPTGANTRPASVATPTPAPAEEPAEEEEDAAQAEESPGELETRSGTVKRRRVTTRV